MKSSSAIVSTAVTAPSDRATYNDTNPTIQTKFKVEDDEDWKTSEMIVQRRLQRKKIRRNMKNDSSSSSSDEEEVNVGSKREIKPIVYCKSNKYGSDRVMNSISSAAAAAAAPTSSTDKVIKWNNNATNTSKPETKTINATDAIRAVANQSLNDELSLLQRYTQTGEMDNVLFGSQSVFSEELLQNGNNLIQSSFLACNGKGLSQQMDGNDNDEGVDDEMKLNNPNESNSNCRKTKKLNMNMTQDEDNDYDDKLPSSSNNPQSSTTPTKLIPDGNGNSEQQGQIQVSQISFSSPLPLLSIYTKSKSMQDTTFATLSQISNQSGYDMIIGAAQALAEKEGEINHPYHYHHHHHHQQQKQQSISDFITTPTPPITPLPKMKQQMDINIETPAPNSTMNTNMPILPEATSSTSIQNPNVPPSLKTDKRTRSMSPAAFAVIIESKIPRVDTSITGGIIHTNSTFYTVRRTIAQVRQQHKATNYTAQRAAALVQQLLDNHKVEKQLLLSMALTRENPRSAPSSYPPIGTVIVNGFYWGQFPPLEKVLRSYMEEYYELSIEKCQSRTQQAFNNKLVTLIKDEASKYGWIFDEAWFHEKKLRDRIRCFFKTHIQNAKKRLKTMVKNPLKRANAKALAKHLDLIEKCELTDKINIVTAKGVGGGSDVGCKTESVGMVEVKAKGMDVANRSNVDFETHDAAQVVSAKYD